MSNTLTLKTIKVSAMALTLVCTGCKKLPVPTTSTTLAELPSIVISEELTLQDYLTSVEGSKESHREKLTKQLSSTWDANIAVGDKKGLHEQNINSCNAFFIAEQSHLEPIKPSEFSPYRKIGLTCQATKIALALIKPGKSFFGHFNLDMSAPKSLPIDFALIISAEEEKRIRNNEQYHRWVDVEPIDSVERVSADTLLFKSKGVTHTITRLAMGDFNQDQVEDMLLMDNASLNEGSYASTRLFVLTKLSDQSEIKALAVFH